MKKNKLLKFTTTTTLLMTNILNIRAEGIIFNDTLAKETLKEFLTKLNTIGMFIVPFGLMAFCVWKYLTWLPLDEQEKAQKPFFKSIKTALIGGVFIFSLQTILKIFGIA